jgi:YD repeat-containing protein
MAKYIFDSKGRVIGSEQGDMTFDERGMLVARFNRNGQTYDDRGKVVGKGDQRLRELGNSRDED